MNESIIRRVGLTKQTGKTDKRGKRIFYILMFIVFFLVYCNAITGEQRAKQWNVSGGLCVSGTNFMGKTGWEQ